MGNRSLRGFTATEMLVLHSILVFLCSIILDCGQVLMCCLGAMASFWLGVIWMVLRRRGKLNHRQRAFINYGALPIIIVTMFVMHYVAYESGLVR